MSFFRIFVLLATLTLLGTGCDFATKQYERAQLSGRYTVAGDSSFTALWAPADTLVDLEDSGASFTMNLSSSGEDNKGSISGSVVIPDSIYASEDSTQLLFRDSVDVQFQGDYVFVIDRLVVRLEEDTSGTDAGAPIPLEWAYEDGRLSGTTMRRINRNGQAVPAEDAIGAVSLSVELEKQ